ncbi:hypothetical protein COL27_29090, partial [Bacillus sp. AFS075960]
LTVRTAPTLEGPRSGRNQGPSPKSNANPPPGSARRPLLFLHGTGSLDGFRSAERGAALSICASWTDCSA